MKFGARIVDAIADHRPAIVLALADDVHLVTAARAVFDLPKLVICGIDREALWIAVAVAPDLGSGAFTADERIVRWSSAIGGDADDLAEMIGEVLGFVAAAIVFAESDEEIAVAGLYDAAAIMIAAGEWAFLTEDDLQIVEPGRRAIDEFGPRNGRASAGAGAFGVAEVDRAVLRKVLVGDDVEQAALAGGHHLGHTFDRRR